MEGTDLNNDTKTVEKKIGKLHLAWRQINDPDSEIGQAFYSMSALRKAWFMLGLLYAQIDNSKYSGGKSDHTTMLSYVINSYEFGEMNFEEASNFVMAKAHHMDGASHTFLSIYRDMARFHEEGINDTETNSIFYITYGYAFRSVSNSKTEFGADDQDSEDNVIDENDYEEEE